MWYVYLLLGLERSNDIALSDFIIILVLWIHVFVYVHRFSFIRT